MVNPRVMTCLQRKIGDEYPCFLIAEAGVNHNGSLDLAKRLIDEAKRAGADAVKFQTFKTEELILEGMAKAPYQQRTTDQQETQTDMLRRLEIDRPFHEALMAHCQEQDILFLSTCYDRPSLDLLQELQIPLLKIASTDTTNVLFLEEIARTQKPVILSTGMCTEEEIQQAHDVLVQNGCPSLAILKCTTNYPTQDAEVNLRGMLTLMARFNVIIGFSDHTPGVGASVYAAAMGAKIIEKHFTLDKNLPGPDHQASLNPQELKAWVDEIRRVEVLLGSAKLGPTESEVLNKKAMQKHLVTRVPIKKGAIITRDMLRAKRTSGQGIGARFAFEVIGSKAVNDLSQESILMWEDINASKR